MLAPLIGLWIGDRLGRIERACLRSALRQGHAVALYCYGPVDGVPEEVELRDAAEIVPATRIIRHRSGSVSLFSNLFRYESQRRALGTWVDCDAYFLRPLDHQGPYLFGFEAQNMIATGVLRMPSESPLLTELIELFAEKRVPHWLPLRSRLAASARLIATGRSGLAKMPWGVAGPKAFTALARQHGLIDNALPSDVLYPVRWQDAAWIRNPQATLESRITERSVSVHLWNECIKPFKDEPPPPGSFLARLHQEGN